MVNFFISRLSSNDSRFSLKAPDDSSCRKTSASSSGDG